MGFLVPIHPLNFYPFGRAHRLSQTLGMASFMISMGEVAIVVHSEGEGACKLKVLTELQGSLDVGERSKG